ncbi:MAG: hypothetical protein HWE15_06205 [Algoriphagus sp.]|uniref:hypothetical protein n=1 Tax=Algoriphagus sp. TaxID=1872435 RepID=UPI0017AC5F47|nr:hypothetical protein [Algoriphagus sp.]NVJ85878.1 hypothetical protein [Algoriphagus sp.]
MEQLLQSKPNFSIDDALKRGWELYKETPILLSLFFFIYIGIAAASSYWLEDFSFIISILISPALMAGFYLVANKISRGETIAFEDFFTGFNFWFPVVVVNLVSGILTGLGILALILPGIYLGVAYAFCLPFVLFAGTEFWTSMELSRKLITKIWWRFFAFLLLLVVINMVGLLFLGIGLLVSGPVSLLAVYAAFEDLAGSYLADDDQKVNLPHEPEP